jgi:hypothetical protein
VTALSLTASVLLVALWVRSLFRADLVIVRMTSASGVLAFTAMGRTSFWAGQLRQNHNSTWHPMPHSKVADLDAFAAGWGFEFSLEDGSGRSGLSGIKIMLPHWSMLFVFGIVGAATWLPWRYSLRTLLIATTLVAVVLGVVIVAT